MSKQVIGFDLGEKTLKMVQLTGNTVKAAICEELPDNLVLDGRILSVDAMVDFIKEAAKAGGIPAGNVSMVLPVSKVFVRNLSMPAVDDQQMKYNMGYIFKDYLTRPQGEYTFDYSVYDVKENPDAPPDMRFMACAVQTAFIEEYRSVLKKAGFRLKCAVPQEVAIANLLGRIGKENQDSCVIDLGHRSTTLNMFHGIEPAAKSTLPRGGLTLDEIIAADEGVDMHMACSYKVTNYNRVLNSSRCMESFRSLSVEIMKAVNFFNYNHSGSGIQEIYLCGGGAAAEPLRKELQDAAGIPVTDSARLLKANSQAKLTGQHILACGAAMNEV